MRMRSSIAVVAVSAVGVLSTGVASSAPASASLRTPPVIHLVGTAQNSIAGMPSSIHAGRVTLSMVSRNRNGSDMGLFRLRSGYTVSKFVRDYKIAATEGPPTKATPAAIRRINAGINAVSAPAPEFGRTVSTTFTLYPGTYYWFNAHLRTRAVTTRYIHPLRVFGSVAPRAFPHVNGTVRMASVKGKMRWSSPASLPHHGRILVHNSTDELHFLVLQRVKKGTTYRQVQNEFNAFLTGRQPTVNVFLNHAEGMDVLSPGNQVVLGYNLPAGTYDLECFIPDDRTGVPHAFMGMHRIVVLK